MTKQVSKHRVFSVQRSYSYESKNTKETEIQWRNRISEEMKELISSENQTKNKNGKFPIEWCYYIFHDKDSKFDDDGNFALDSNGNLEFAPLHVHILIRFSTPRTTESVKKKLHATRDESCKPTKDITGSAQYLLHTTQQAMMDHKYRYATSELFAYVADTDSPHYAYQFYYELAEPKTKKDTAKNVMEEKTMFSDEVMKFFDNNLYDDIFDRKLREEEVREIIFDEFGEQRDKDGDIIKPNRSKVAWRIAKNLVQSAIADSNKAHDAILRGSKKLKLVKPVKRDLKVYYLYGAGGSGKTRLANELGLLLSGDDPMHIVPTAVDGITYDFAQGYQNEKVSILNDFSPKNFKATSFNGIFDNNVYSPTASRNHNVAWTPDYAMITNSLDYNEFFAKMVEKEDADFVDADGEVKKNYNAQDLLSQTKRRVACSFYLEKSGYCEMSVRSSHKSDFKTKTGSNAEFYDFTKVKEFNFGVLSEEENVKKLAKAVYDELGNRGLR